MSEFEKLILGQMKIAADQIKQITTSLESGECASPFEKLIGRLYIQSSLHYIRELDEIVQRMSEEEKRLKLVAK